ncbi:MAG: hypothetical protein ACRD1P_09080 [Thermoanaerobaculia bacterium]
MKGTLLEVDRVVRVDSLQVDDVLEVPTDENVNPSDGGKSDVQRISAHVLPDSAVLDVGSREILRLGGQRDGLNVHHGHSPENYPDSLRRGFEFPKRELGQHQGQVAAFKRLKQAAGGLAKLLVFAATQH